MGKRTAIRMLLGVLALAATLLMMPAAAAAASQFTSKSWAGCDGGFNSGGFDTAGRTYVPCGNPTTIGVYARDGSLLQSIPLNRFVTDVEPVGDGSLLYLGGYDAPQRLVRGAGGDYAIDTTWHPDAYPFEGGHYPAAGLFVDSDAAGNVYYADGYWASGRHTVVEYDPNGRYVTRFGEYVENSWALGDFYWALGGIAVSPDGLSVLTTETGNNRLQKWTRAAAGANFAPSSTFGGSEANNADRGGYCDFVNWQGAFAAPYDINLDAAGNVYVINTTCKQVLRFTPDLSTMTADVDVRVNGGDYPRPHGFAVSPDGMVFVGQNQRVLIPTGSTANVTAVPQRPAGAPSTPETTPDIGDHSATPTSTNTNSPQGSVAADAPNFAGAQNAFTASLALRRPYSVRTPTRQLIYATLKCSAHCNVALRIRAAGRDLGTYRVPAWTSDGKNIVLSLPRRASGRNVTFIVTATPTGGNHAPVIVARTYAVRA